MEDCIFCKIIAGKIPSIEVYEDEEFRAIMDIEPASKGHVIIISKQHAANVFELSKDLASKVYVVAKKIAKALKEEFNCDGVNILQNNGEVAGQTVYHFHMHVIPRYKDDTINIKWDKKSYDMDTLSKVADKIKKNISAE